jgi:hypothetical protein
MESGPSQIAEAVVGWPIPPACREEVLGDMRERRQSPGQYLLEAVHIIPFVIYSRIRRATDAVVALTEAVSMYTAFVMAAWWLDHALLFNQQGFTRLAIPTAIFLAAIILADAYSNPKKRWPLKPLFGPILGFALAYLVQLGPWALPAPVLAWGGGISVLLVSTLRLTFPPVTDRPQAAANAPAYWQKLELLPLSSGLKSALLPCAILLAVILYLLKK